MNSTWVPHDIRDKVVDFVYYWSLRTEISQSTIIRWIPIAKSKFYHWKKRYGKANEHNGWIPRDFWLENWEKEAIIEYRNQGDVKKAARLICEVRQLDSGSQSCPSNLDSKLRTILYKSISQKHTVHIGWLL